MRSRSAEGPTGRRRPNDRRVGRAADRRPERPGRGQPGPLRAGDPGGELGHCPELPVPQPDRLREPDHPCAAIGEVDPLVADVRRAAGGEGQQDLALATLRPAGHEHAQAVMDEGRGVDRQEVPAERGEVDDRDEERDRPDPALGHDPARAADPVERDRHPDRRLEPAAQKDERRPVEGRIVAPDRAQRTVGRQPFDVLDLDLRRTGQGPFDRAQLAADRGRVGPGRPDQPDPDGPVEIEVHRSPGRVGHRLGQRTKVRMA